MGKYGPGVQGAIGSAPAEGLGASFSSGGTWMWESDGGKLLTPGMRLMLLVASALVFSVGVSLFLLTEETDRYFAWTIANPLTAAFLGAGYWASGVLEFVASRERYWRNARIAVPAVLLFTVLTLIVTVVHSDSFHFDDGRFIAAAGTWFWLGVYAFVPLIMGWLLFQVGWSTGAAAAVPRRPLGAVRYVLLVQGLVMVVLGTTLLVAPQEVDGLWPWALTDLTGRAIGAWLVALGVAALHVAAEDDFERARAAVYAYLALAALQLIAVARYRDILDWEDAKAYVYVAFLLSMLGAAFQLTYAAYRAKTAVTRR
jgi:hypothetical protein